MITPKISVTPHHNMKHHFLLSSIIILHFRSCFLQRNTCLVCEVPIWRSWPTPVLPRKSTNRYCRFILRSYSFQFLHFLRRYCAKIITICMNNIGDVYRFILYYFHTTFWILLALSSFFQYSFVAAAHGSYYGGLSRHLLDLWVDYAEPQFDAAVHLLAVSTSALHGRYYW